VTLNLPVYHILNATKQDFHFLCLLRLLSLLKCQVTLLVI